MAEAGTILWPYECFGASTFKRTDRVNCPPGEFPEVWGYDGSIENGCRPLSGMRFIAGLAGNTTAITGASGYTAPLSMKNAFQIQLRVGDDEDEYVDGFVYRISDAGGISRVFFKWRKPNATSYESDRPIKTNPTTTGGTDPRLDGNQPMDVVVNGKFCYVLISGSSPMMFYFNDVAADASNLIVEERTGPGPEPDITQAPYILASKDTDGTNVTYKKAYTNSYGNSGGSGDPGTNWLNLTAPSRNEIQTVSFTGAPTGGTFTLSFRGQTTSGIAYNANAAAVQSALEALSNIAPGDVTVTGGSGPSVAWKIEFTGTYAATDVGLLIGSGASLTGGSSPKVRVETTQRIASGVAKLYPFSFFDTSNTPPANVTNPLAGPTDLQATGTSIYAVSGLGIPVDPVFEEFSSQKKIYGPTLTGVPNEATDSRHSNKLGPIDANRRYGFVVQFWDKTNTGRISKPSKVLEYTAFGTGEEPYRAPVYDTKQISGTETGTGPPETAASSLYLVAAGHRCSFTGIEVIYDSERYDTLLVYRTVADNPKGLLSLDGVFTLKGKFDTRNQSTAHLTDLTSPWKRAFVFTRTPESQIAQQPSFDSSAFLMDEEMPFAGSGILMEGTLLVGNIGVADTDASGMGVVRWSSTSQQTIECFSPLARFALRAPGEEIIRFVHNGPNVLGFSRQNIYLFRKEGVYVRGYHVAGGIGATNRRGVCEVGSTTYVVTQSGLYTVTQNGGISAVRAVHSLMLKDWAHSLNSVHLAFDQEGKCVVMHNVDREETCILWLETSRITLLKDMPFSVVNDGSCPKNGQLAGNVQQRACFYQQYTHDANTGEQRWRVYVLDIFRDKSINYTGHPDHGHPQLMTLHPDGVEGRQKVYATFSSGTTLKVKAAGMSASTATRLEGCYLYVADATNTTLIGAKAKIESVSLGTDAGASHTLTLTSATAANLHGLAVNDSLFLSPVYCLALGWSVGILNQDETKDTNTRDKFRQRLIASIFPVFTDVSGPDTLTDTTETGGNGYSALARFAGVVFNANETTPELRAFPAETDGTTRRSIINEAAIIGAPLNAPYGYMGTNIYPGIETFVSNLDYQLVSFNAEGRILDARRPGRALTGGESS